MSVPKHKKYPPAGEKQSVRSSRIWIDLADAQAVAEGEEVTLMDWGNAILKKITKGAGGEVTAIEARDAEGAARRRRPPALFAHVCCVCRVCGVWGVRGSALGGGRLSLRRRANSWDPPRFLRRASSTSRAT